MKSNKDLQLLILRIALGVLMLLHGIAKMKNGVSGMGDMLTAKSIPSFVAYGVFLGEVLAPLMLIVGFRTKIAAFLFAFTMVVAVFLVHSNDIGRLSESGGWKIELPALYFFGALSLFFSGAGKYALSTSSKWD